MPLATRDNTTELADALHRGDVDAALRALGIDSTFPEPAELQDSFSPSAAVLVRADETPLHALARLRKEASAEVERLLAFLDATEADSDLEPCCEDEGAQCEDEGAQDSGIGDQDGLMEQCPQLFEHSSVRVLA